VTVSRRQFLAHAGMMAAALGARRSFGQAMPSSNVSRLRRPLSPNTLAKYVDPLPSFETIQPIARRPSPNHPRHQVPYYKVVMRQFEAKLHRDLGPTHLWGYSGGSPGPIFETRSGEELLVEWVNQLPPKHFLPIDHTIHGAEDDKPEVRTVVHLHGAKAPPRSDGYPENWYEPGKSAVFDYPNRQDGTMLWYHDHALGINRLNIFAGLLGIFFVRDDLEDSLKLPRGKFEIPLVIYDRSLDVDGQLNYPVSGNPKSPWVPEFSGEAVVINGKVFPYLEVEPRKYRFRILNGSNGKAISLTFNTGQAAWFPKFFQIGSDQGLLSSPASVVRIRLAPAERADVIFDFSSNAGSNVFLRNNNLDVMQFRVLAKGSEDDSLVPQTLRPIRRIAEAEAIKTRFLTLIEIDEAGKAVRMLLNNAHWNMPVTENPALDSVEIWNLINLTSDDHPIHLHLVRFQILDRRAFDAPAYRATGELKYVGPALPPPPEEAGWKDTVRADHGMVTRIIIPFEGFAGRYVWHCHNLEHEDNEMMRPFDVVAR
jgi:spore coat protein A, manganese oxidase